MTHSALKKITERLTVAYLVAAIPALMLSGHLYLSHRPWSASMVWAGFAAAGFILSHRQRKLGIRPASRLIVALFSGICAALLAFNVSVFLMTYSM